jgi:hypothetical protein
MSRVRIRTTEIEVDVDDSHIQALINRALGFPANPVRLSPLENVVQYSDAPTLEPTLIATRRHRSATRKRNNVRTASSSGDGRDELIGAIIAHDLAEHEAYNAALRAATAALDRSLIVIHLAKSNSNEKELSSTEIVKILESKFSIPMQEPSIRKALMRAANLKPPLVAPTKGPRGNRYWLTQDGLDRAAALIRGDT